MGKLVKNNVKAEMGFFDHIEELRWHIIRSLIAIATASLFMFSNKKFLFDYLLFGPTRPDFPANRFFCWLAQQSPYFFSGLCMQGKVHKFINTDLAGQFYLHFEMAAISGAIIASPYVIWEIWRFIKPALYEQEIKKTTGVLFFVIILFLLGCMFGYFIIAPFSVNFFLNYEAVGQAENLISVDNYISNLISMVLPTGIMFELPVVVYFLTRIGLITPAFMRNTRKFAYIIILGAIAVITPQGDMFSLVLISTPIFILYQVSIGISQRVYNKIVRED
ncbi:MAG TPA: twin-arginine translocase subunit TatC [Chitinophagales bacterium]|nr:twin-arginine translocase subunit TatC [Chitinophagales bacterium]HNL84120.1 twin-arginine translocase subunit TatC [Chitinophagales bacterium]